MTKEEAALMKVCILREEREAVLRRILPDRLITGLSQPNVSDVI